MNEPQPPHARVARAALTGLVALVGMMGGCPSASHTLTLRVQSGLRAGYEVRHVEARLYRGAVPCTTGDDPLEVSGRALSPTDQAALATGALTVTTFDALQPGVYTVRARFRRPPLEPRASVDSGPLLVERCVVATIASDRVVRVALTSDCIAVQCPAPAGSAAFDQCLNGRCVDPRCDPDDPSSAALCCDAALLGVECEATPTLCVVDGDCARTLACALPPRCEGGVCVEPEGDACADGEYCDAMAGACAAVPPLDDGDAGAADAGVLDASLSDASFSDASMCAEADPPDDAGLDSNCDGADGVVGSTIYASPSGRAAGDGLTPTTAVTLPRALEVAAVSGMPLVVLVASGSHELSRRLVAPDGVELHGGYAADFRSRGAERSIVRTVDEVALLVGPGVSARVRRIDFTTTDRIVAGESTRTIEVQAGSLDLFDSEVVAGRGGASAPGTAGAAGAAGAIGEAGGDGGSTPGVGGGSGSARGGSGVAYTTACTGLAGTDGEAITPCAAPPGGPGGACVSGACMCDFLSSFPGTSGGAGQPGCAGGPGSHGMAGSGIGQIGPGGWTAPSAGVGVGGGLGGRGSSGGGGAGAACSRQATGGGGGQGGAGGGGGEGGMPGGAGGGAFGILAFGGSVTLEEVRITTGSGGEGGAGGVGGDGGEGGSGGAGGAGGQTTLAPCGGSFSEGIEGGSGGRGGLGGRGGRGGCGGGGVGGPSIGIFTFGTALFEAATTIAVGAGGAGGAACTPGGNAGGDGTQAQRLAL